MIGETLMKGSLSANSTISHYRILSPLGAGGMGEVWLAEDTMLERKVALKLLPAEFTKDPDRVRRFEQEAKAVSALNHPHIITIHEIGEAEPGRFIVMELVEGQTLRELNKPCTPDALVDIGRQNPHSEAEAESCYQKAIEIARRQSAKSFELRASTSLARLWQQQGKIAEARRTLAQTYGWFTEGFETPDLKDARALLEDLHESD